MDVKVKIIQNNLISNENGQSVVEFVIFLPFLLMLYSLTVSIGNAINGSINQQKVTRAYFYYTLQNNSTFPRPSRGGSEDPYSGWNRFGMQIIGWSEKLVNEQPVMACYRFKLPLGNADGDECESAYKEKTTQFIRVGTVYGVCGATYQKSESGQFYRQPSGGPYDPQIVSTGESCLIQ